MTSAIVEDITPRKLAEARIQYLATHDELTGLPNRVIFVELLAHALEGAQPAQSQMRGSVR